MILLDTCVLLWLNTDRAALTPRAMKALNRHADGLAFSPVSVMEIDIKKRKGKLELPASTAEWMKRLVSDYGLIQIPLNLDISCAVTRLPEIHNDPFDRIILATATVNRFSVITSDPVIAHYPGVTVIW